MALEKRLILFGRLDREGPELDAFLVARGFRAYTVENELELLDVVAFSRPDAVLLIGPPPQPLLSQLLKLNQRTGQTLVVVLWPGAPVSDAVKLLDGGVDHVVTTFQPDWLAAQIRADLRRSGRERSAPSVLDLDYLRIDLQQRCVTVHGREVMLTPTEFDVLQVLAERPGVVLPSGEVMQQVMGVRMAEAEAQDLLKVHIHRLRQKLDHDPGKPGCIRTVRGHGYMYAFERRSQERSASLVRGA
jgi:DNA-binding response OmpR family regulator